jgi:hypothetical protein
VFRQGNRLESLRKYNAALRLTNGAMATAPLSRV